MTSDSPVYLEMHFSAQWSHHCNPTYSSCKCGLKLRTIVKWKGHIYIENSLRVVLLIGCLEILGYVNSRCGGVLNWTHHGIIILFHFQSMPDNGQKLRGMVSGSLYAYELSPCVPHSVCSEEEEDATGKTDLPQIQRSHRESADSNWKLFRRHESAFTI